MEHEGSSQKLREIVDNMKKKNNLGVFLCSNSKEQGNSTKMQESLRLRVEKEE